MKNRYFIIGLMVAITVIAADQFCKWWMLELVDIDARPPIMVTGFFNLVMVWNHGVSFGMLAGKAAPIFLIAVALALVGILAVWLYRSHETWSAFALGSVIGGALGNVIDRARFGAVADFFDFHLYGYHWPAFNIADSMIFIGVAILCIRSMVAPHSNIQPKV